MKFAKITLSLLYTLIAVVCQANEATSAEPKAFNAGEMIIEHVTDAHELHFFTTGEGTPAEHHVSVPLPIILYDKENGGLKSFWSSAFHHAPNGVHEGYAMHHEKIYRTDATGGISFDDKKHPTNSQPLDFSITKTVLGIFVVIAAMIAILFSVANSYKRRKAQAPSGMQSVLEPLLVFIRDEIAKPSIGKKYERYMPYLLTVFFFIFLSNLLGLIPFIGGFNITGNIAVTLVLALCNFLITAFTGNKNYWSHIFLPPGIPGWLLPLMIPIEILGLFTKPIVLTLRLFANITAGHIIILSFISLIFIFGSKYGAGAGIGVSVLSVAFSIFMNLMELLVAFLQAYVFTLLSALYFGSAVDEHHHDTDIG